eukprot:CAMPEP_0115848254 /NCGR_PEP_ID=MMETSP0287-20121206/10824_1 /TAXON_ID=412157 /ORGANISM="Chrysochromulina rotalis, Strain UIO044" /LENGTH=247 /DNA_ID=CAMNT_0003302155 /DNA_START=179 /DNA_END=922 /DNA_ORIENTATION=-
MIRCLGALRSPSSTRLLRSEGLVRHLATADPRSVRLRSEHLDEALKIMRAYAVGRYEESVDLAIRLNVDVKRSDERVRGSVLLPHGTGKTTRVAVFARGELADEARAAGADVVGAEELVEEVLKGRLDFERVLAAPDVLPVMAKAARTLGPKGLMPNPKRGTVTTEITAAVQRAKGGEVEFRAQKTGIVLSSIGRVTFSNEHLRNNALTLMESVLVLRPQRFRNKAPTSITLCSTLGPAVKLDHRLW